ncbi:hypothetical protein O3M35_003312 [Rhynocoris fuscipes]|uniref:Rad50/SbcC-type AAA domain-containing protein n=1 Tax=Rhynocoris fuscipes TaxID=488301 RepID=A0AAW1CMM6_9HEMI
MVNNEEDRSRIRSNKRTRETTKKGRSECDEDDMSPSIKRMSVDRLLGEIQPVPGKVKRIRMYNFMCHSQLEFNFGDRINFISGKNGSGKSAILTALVIGLGGKTKDTNRGQSLKNLIKFGQNSAQIDITLQNEGPSSFNTSLYGNELTVTRKITDKTSAYKFLSEKGKVISTKRDELLYILKTFKIQINNPMCILNQDVARTFLSSTTPTEFYNLFLRGTLIEDITTRLDNLIFTKIPRIKKQFEQAQQEMLENSREVLELLEKKLQLSKLRNHENEYNQISNELLWSYVSSLESNVGTEEKLIKDYEKNLERIRFKVENRDKAVNEMKTNLKVLEEKMNTIKNKNLEQQNDNLQTESEYSQTKELVGRKMNEIKKIEAKKAEAVQNIEEIEKLIENQESHSKEIEAKKNSMKIEKAQLEKKLDELKAVLSTTEVHRKQLSDTVDMVKKNMAHKSRFLDNITNSIRHKENNLRSMKDNKNKLSVYSSWMPGLVETVNTAHEQGKFEQMPRGPIGSYIKLKDESWGPAIEYFFGRGALTSFCVHSKNDYEVLYKIFVKLNIPVKERPSVFISKFLPKVHNVSANETATESYRSLLNMLVISDPVISNAIIDQFNAEQVLLIPTNAEAYPLMEDINNVPRKCNNALTKTGDRFYPQPHYASYSGNIKQQTRFIQSNPENIIKLIEEEIKKLKRDYETNQEQMQELDKKYKTNRKCLDNADKELKKLTMDIGQCEAKLMELDQQEVPESFEVNVLSEDLLHWKGKLESCNKAILEIENTKKTLLEKAKDLNIKLKEFEKIKKQKSDELSGAMNEITQMKNELQKINQNHDHYVKLMKDEERKYVEHENKLKQLKIEYQKAITEATKTCPEKIETVRSVEVLKEKQAELERTIRALKNTIKNEDIVEPADFDYRMQKFEKNQLELKTRQSILNEIEEVVEKLPSKVDTISRQLGVNTDKHFQKILKERHFLGTLKFDHDKKRLDIIIKPDPRAVELESPILTLSGGERSFSMVAFIMALWKNMSSPFYFLDEFDVFMDEVNRKMVMDLLINTAKSNPEHQYVFLTPHSTMAEEDSKIINIFRMNDPRENNV